MRALEHGSAVSSPEARPSSTKHVLNRLHDRHAVLLIALVAGLVRLAYLSVDPSRDEAGYLLVGQQWHSGGTSLYGNYWVDRPPLLITIYRIAAQLGGLVPLRLIGCLATVLIVVGTAHVARRLGGQRAARWAALTAAALCVTPLLGGEAVNGELLSAPFVVGGLAAVIAAMDQPSPRRTAAAATLAGAAGMAAVLVKQNIADVAVFAGVALLVALRRGDISRPRVAGLILALAVGAMTCLGLVSIWTVAHGTSVPGVFDAMYPFRIEAGRIMVHSNRTAADARLWMLVARWVVSGGAVIMGVAGYALATRRLRGAAVWGLVGTVLFDAVSIALGGSYWSHYLIQLVVPVAVLSGLLAVAGPRTARRLLTAVAVSAVVALGVTQAVAGTSPATSLGHAVRDVALPQDTIVTTWGHADVTRASGLSSPYPYLWSLPARIRDPRLTGFDALLSGPNAPTWLVTWRDVRTWHFHGGAAVTRRLLAAHYDPVAQDGGHTIYLHRGVERPPPDLSPTGADLSGGSTGHRMPAAHPPAKP